MYQDAKQSSGITRRRVLLRHIVSAGVRLAENLGVLLRLVWVLKIRHMSLGSSFEVERETNILEEMISFTILRPNNQYSMRLSAILN